MNADYTTDKMCSHVEIDNYLIFNILGAHHRTATVGDVKLILNALSEFCKRLVNTFDIIPTQVIGIL